MEKKEDAYAQYEAWLADAREYSDYLGGDHDNYEMYLWNIVHHLRRQLYSSAVVREEFVANLGGK